ncbi:MAG TPA: chemotaxis protein CheB, partial [Planctomycetota bacterium]|nr:chemotaxis protein CheB [Planctomycetota bacterium]
MEPGTEVAPPPADRDFPIIGLGASAGGLEAFEKFFKQMPPDTGMAFVLVQHLDATHKSILADLIQRYTKMPAVQVDQGMLIEPNHVYVIPPNRYLAVEGGAFRLSKSGESPGQKMPIDFLFRSLAADRGEKAIAVILSGTGTDGTLGLKAVKESGGMVMVESERSAKYDGMPRSAVATGIVDYVLPVEEMPAKLIHFVDGFSTIREALASEEPSDETTKELRRIFSLLRARTGHDFSYYKLQTLLRRIARRMQLHHLASLVDYVAYLEANATEVDQLFKEFLISVTNFFRDPVVFET